MASTRDGRLLTEAHRQEQVALRAGFLGELIPLWTLLDWYRIDETTPAWLQAVMGVLRSWRQESAVVAESYYDRYREVEVPDLSIPVPSVEHIHAPEVRGHREPDRPVVVNLDDRRADLRSKDRDWADVAHFGEFKPAVLDWGDIDPHVVRSITGAGPDYLKHLSKRGEREEPAKLKALVTVSGVGSRHVLNGGRNTLEALIKADPVVNRWIRVTDGDPCSFCAMLAGRGPVYVTATSAGFSAHDNCACTAEPVFSSKAAWPGDAALYRRLWRENIEGKYSGNDALNAWRRLYEGRRREQQQPEQITA